MASAAQLLLLADHINLSLLERQRAISLKLEPNTQDAQISRSLESLKEGIESLESQQSASQDAARLRSQYADLYDKFHGNADTASSPLSKPNNPSLSSDFAKAARMQTGPSNTRSTSGDGLSKSVRFRDDPSEAEQEAASRAALFPYRDDPDEPPDQSNLDNQQIHEYHSQVLRQQDEQLEVIGRSVGRQHELSIQIGNELDDQVHMLDDVEQLVDRHQTQIDRARDRIGKIARKAKDNLQITIIIILVIILVLLLIILK